MIYGAGRIDGTTPAEHRQTVKRITKAFTKHLDRFDYIAVRGISGLMVGAPVSLAINKPLVVVRKPDEKCHSTFKDAINGYAMNMRDVRKRRCVFLDDFRETGNTERAVVESVSGYGGYLVATYLYQQTYGSRAGWHRVIDHPERPLWSLS